MSNNCLDATKREYGGFLPLELRDGKEYFDAYDEMLMRLNSVKSAIRVLQDQINWSKIYIPYYYCPSTAKVIEEVSNTVVFYHIGQSLEPESIPDEDNTAVLLVNYFGVKDDFVISCAKEFEKATVIIDNAHSFFCNPVIKDNVYNMYSAKKFFGVFDGAYLIGKQLKKRSLPQMEAYENAGFLLSSYEKGTNFAYISKKKADEFIAASCSGMSVLSKGILQGIDYEFVRSVRNDNARYLKNKLAGENGILVNEDVTPYLFPFLPKNSGIEIKKHLVNIKVYVPTIWSGENLLNNANLFEMSICKDGVFLPVDQRYGIDDMKYIVQKIEEIADGNT